MKTITVANRKGGVGKTICSFNLGYSKANSNKKTLLIDMDSQGNLTKACGVDFITVDEFLNVHTENVAPNLDIISAPNNFRELEKIINSELVPTNFLVKNIMPQIKGYDYVIIDTSPSTNILNTNSFLASDMILIIVKLDYFSMLGMSDMYSIIEQVREINPNLEYKVICNQYFKNRTLNTTIENQLKTLEGYVNIAIPHRQQIMNDILNHKPSIGSIEEFNLISEYI